MLIIALSAVVAVRCSGGCLAVRDGSEFLLIVLACASLLRGVCCAAAASKIWAGKGVIVMAREKCSHCGGSGRCDCSECNQKAFGSHSRWGNNVTVSCSCCGGSGKEKTPEMSWGR